MDLHDAVLAYIDKFNITSIGAQNSADIFEYFLDFFPHKTHLKFIPWNP